MSSTASMTTTRRHRCRAGRRIRLIPIFEEQVRGFERLRAEDDLPAAAERSLRAQLAHMVLLASRLRGLLARGASRRGDEGIQVSPGACGPRISPCGRRTCSAGFGCHGNDEGAACDKQLRPGQHVAHP